MITKALLSIFIGALAYGLTFHTDLISGLPAWMQLALYMGISALVFFGGNLYNYAEEVRNNQRLRNANVKLSSKTRATAQELTDLKQVLVLFMENSEIYRQKVADLLRLTDDYLCIVKSSEGLGEAREVLAPSERTKYPFGKVLSGIQGSVEPFEHAGMFLIPTSSLPGITARNIRRYVDHAILPQVVKERRKYLKRLPNDVAQRAETLSFKYVAFLLRKESITYDTRNRKFQRPFMALMVDGQDDRRLGQMKNELQDVLRTKDILTLVDLWSISGLNRDQLALIARNKDAVHTALTAAGYVHLTDFIRKPETDLYQAIRPVLAKRHLSKKKTQNICTKLIQGARRTIETLNKAGVTL